MHSALQSGGRVSSGGVTERELVGIELRSFAAAGGEREGCPRENAAGAPHREISAPMRNPTLIPPVLHDLRKRNPSTISSVANRRSCWYCPWRSARRESLPPIGLRAPIDSPASQPGRGTLQTPTPSAWSRRISSANAPPGTSTP